jgi:uncharacterized protein
MERLINLIAIKYNPSIYNYWYHSEDNSTHLLYNTYTGALVSVLNSDLTDVLSLLENPNDIILRERRRDLFRKMVECGFIVEENTDELSFLKFRFYRGAFSGRNLSLILLPTRVCNFKCVYCFEKEINDTMTDEDCKNILQFVRREIYIRKPEALVVSWYGGEPLLAFNTIKNLSMELLSITKSSKIEYEAGIVTNGYLLDENIAQELVNLNVKLIQITLDGPAEIHNKRRPLKNGSPTFHKIRESIVIAKRHFPQVEIRLNVDEVGALNPDGKFIPNKNFINYFFDQHPCEVEPCKSCKILPLCMGGCQVIRKKCKDEDELKAAICDHFWSLLNK